MALNLTTDDLAIIQKIVKDAVILALAENPHRCQWGFTTQETVRLQSALKRGKILERCFLVAATSGVIALVIKEFWSQLFGG